MGIVGILISCTLFVHMGLADAVMRVTGIRCVLLRCQKCLTFWCVPLYALITNTPVDCAVSAAFVASYASLWLDLLLAKLATKYEEWYQSVDAEESESDSAIRRDKETESGKG